MNGHSGKGKSRLSCAALLAGLLAGTAAGPSFAEPPASSGNLPDYWSIQLENDFFAASGDRYYTHGFEIARLQAGSGPGWLNGLARWLPFFEMVEGETAISYTLGQRIFTPENKEATAVVPGDRPYAGYLYGSAAFYSRFRTIDCLQIGNKLEVTVGLVGPSSGADKTQEFVHKLLGNDIPKGWDNQLQDEAALGISYSRLWSIVQPGPWSLEFGLNPHITGEIGNVYTYAAGGVMFRLGTNLMRDYNPPNIRPGFPGISYFEKSAGSEWYLFFGHESRIMFRDIFLDGNTFKESPHVAKERLVGDYQFGLTFTKDNVRIALSNLARTKEFSGQDKLTRYGAINVSMVF